MFGVLIYDVIFFSVPAILAAVFGVALYRFISAKKKNKVSPGTFSESDIKNRKNMLIVMSVVVGVLAVTVIGFCALMFMAVAYM